MQDEKCTPCIIYTLSCILNCKILPATCFFDHAVYCFLAADKTDENPEQTAKRRKLSGTITTSTGATPVGSGVVGVAGKSGQNIAPRIKFNNQTLYFAALKGDVAKV